MLLLFVMLCVALLVERRVAAETGTVEFGLLPEGSNATIVVVLKMFCST